MAIIPVTSVMVKIRRHGDTYLARCVGKSASSTSAAESAAGRAAAKHFMMLPEHVRLHPNADGSFLALPEANAPKNWRSPEYLQQARMRAAYPEFYR
jgi:hypothetical protein